MKRILPILLCVALLTGCSSLAPDSYHSVTPHEITDNPSVATNAAEASDYHGLKVAILNQIRMGRTDGIIHVTDYEGDVEEDLKQAAYEISALNPLGAYAVEYMTHSCNQLLTYHEIRISISYRRTAQQISQLKTYSTPEQFQKMLTDAVDTFAERVAVQISDYNHEAENVVSFVTEYCISNPATVMEIPKIAVSLYPESGKSRIVEVVFHYENNPQGLQAKQRAVETNIDAAAEYIRYRQDTYDKVSLLYSYLPPRFRYRQAETATPLYDALCSGVADPTGLAQAWKLICDKSDVECLLVTGVKNGQPYTWNILRTGTYYRHLDLAQCVLSGSGLTFHSDGEMSAYSWNMDQYPTCKPLPAAQPAAPAEKAEETAPAEEEETAEETIPEETQEQQP